MEVLVAVVADEEGGGDPPLCLSVILPEKKDLNGREVLDAINQQNQTNFAFLFNLSYRRVERCLLEYKLYSLDSIMVGPSKENVVGLHII